MQESFVGNTQLVAGGADTIPEVLACLQKVGLETKRNPDIYVRSYKSFGIEEARELRERASLRPVGTRRVFVLAAPDLNREAQNALLKTLEEPPGNALFFFLLQSPVTLLATFRSRAQMLVLESAAATGFVDVRKFLASAPDKRIDMLKPLLEKGDDEKRDLGAVLSFLASLERALEKGFASIEAARRHGFESVYRARKYATDKGALIKPLMEQVALLTPRT